MFKTVNLNTDFSAMEKSLLEKWIKEGIIEEYLKKNDGSDKRYSFLDGPITANNPMGVHHAWGRTYKDLWQRFFNMKGYKQRFQNGFDCQGLWVEVEVEKELGIRNKKDIENLVPGKRKESIARFVSLCKERVLKYSAIQTEQSIRLGYFMDWDNSYYTMSDENNYLIWHFLKTCHQKGWIYKGKDSVPWCPRCETAISQHEMLTEDYKEITHETVFLKLKIKNLKLKINAESLYLLVWTTTPWTIPANVAVGVNTKFTYGVWQKEGTGEAVIIIDKDAEGRTPLWNIKNKDKEISGIIFPEKDHTKIMEIKGKELVGLRYEAPFDSLELVKAAERENPDTFHTVVDGSEIVTSLEGTGLLHVAPGAGKEDFDLGKKESLPVISVIEDDASYSKGMGDFAGKNAKKHPELIIDFLKKSKSEFLLRTMHYTHRYPACWRCKAELVWKVAFEWYIAMDRKEKEKGRGEKKKEGKTLREQMMDTAKMISWMPEFGLERELDWLSNMHDWLISKKNRYWGLALPIFECAKCGSFEIIGGRDELKEKAVSGWKQFEDKSPHKPYIDEVRIKCGSCGEEVSRIDDVGNVWLDAGSVPFSTYIDPKTGKLSYTGDKKYWEEWFPADFITESFPGQFKNWFYSMIAMSTVLEKRNPYKRVLGYASMLGEDGRPMHKSWGNAIEFNEGADKIGVDVMRWMFVTHNPEQNLLFGYLKANETRRKFHIPLWNIYNYFITYANLNSWKPGRPIEPQNLLDCWILSKMHSLIISITSSLENYKAYEASVLIEQFVTEMSQWYIRRSRERLGAFGTEADRMEFFSTTHSVLILLSKILAPFVPFLADEIFTNISSGESVHLTSWPLPDKNLINRETEKKMGFVRKLAEMGHALRKEKSLKIRQPLFSLSYSVPSGNLGGDFEKILLSELNIRAVSSSTPKNSSKKDEGFEICIDDRLTPELKMEGEARDIIRKVQVIRKEKGLKIGDRIRLVLPSWPAVFEEMILKETESISVCQGKDIEIELSG